MQYAVAHWICVKGRWFIPVSVLRLSLLFTRRCWSAVGPLAKPISKRGTGSRVLSGREGKLKRKGRPAKKKRWNDARKKIQDTKKRWMKVRQPKKRSTEIKEWRRKEGTQDICTWLSSRARGPVSRTPTVDSTLVTPSEPLRINILYASLTGENRARAGLPMANIL